MKVFRVKYKYAYEGVSHTDPAYYGDQSPRSNETHVIAETLPQAIEKVYIEIMAEEDRRAAHRVTEAQKRNEFPDTTPRKLFVCELNIQQEFIRVIQ